jgi:hypothetical protein
MAVLANARYNEGIRFVDDYNTYTKELHDKLIMKFPGSENIERNYSQVLQDMFALTMTKGTRGLKYLELGAEGPFYYNNTYLLESKFGWDGISIDYKEEKVKQWVGARHNKIICKDATKIDYEKLLKDFSDDREYGYLQIDCEPAEQSFKALAAMPFNEFKFATITFEHDIYDNQDETYRRLSRNLLKSVGYILVASNVSVIGTFAPFEDWYVHPDLVDRNTIDNFMNIAEGTDARKLFLE